MLKVYKQFKVLSYDTKTNDFRCKELSKFNDYITQAIQNKCRKKVHWAKKEAQNISDGTIKSNVDRETKDRKKGSYIDWIYREEIKKNADKLLHFLFNTPGYF